MPTAAIGRFLITFANELSALAPLSTTRSFAPIALFATRAPVALTIFDMSFSRFLICFWRPFLMPHAQSNTRARVGDHCKRSSWGATVAGPLGCQAGVPARCAPATRGEHE